METVEIQCQFRPAGLWQTVASWPVEPKPAPSGDRGQVIAAAKIAAEARHAETKLTYRVQVITAETLFEVARGERGDSH